ncbi:MAG: GNAT family N-acetyltransferase [Flavobacteriales bacterium]|jgi:predicted GNAT family N-acyltransferase|nr:GNAT family N-acetyltransferase [Flavobacteriales bacterium]
MGNEIEFLPYRNDLKTHFVQLNLSWLEEYFVVEPYDQKVLEDCEDQIINKGGHIFFAFQNKTVVGTFAFIKIEEGVYELSKMAVPKTLRGGGIGNLMIRFSIHYAEHHHWKKLILYSNTVLQNSIHLYHKYGYQEIPLEADKPYERSDIKMELILD